MKVFVAPDIIYPHLGTVDYSKSVDGLIVFVEQQLGLSHPVDALFVFRNTNELNIYIG
tara:strand:+ start:1001 stop:1174 length:174 start_codon:yes stop_codon:yes gene_type:complete